MEDRRFKIVLINHSFQINYFSRRWELFAHKYPNVDVTLLAPDEFEWYQDKSYSYGKSHKYKGKFKDSGNFHIRLFRINKIKYIGWYSPDFKRLFEDINPDIIYHIGTHTQLSLFQCLYLTKQMNSDRKIIAFSMRGPALSIRLKKNNVSFLRKTMRYALYLFQKRIQSYIYRNCNAFFCHYPDAVDCFRNEGYKGPIYMQTQVGVNPEWFNEDIAFRNDIRKKYNIKEEIVFGSATRFTIDKGIDDIILALPKEGNWKYLLMGSGSQEQVDRIKQLIHMRELEDKIIMTGFIDWYDMPKYWNAVDCAVHVPHTTEHWEETFSLSIAQAMIIGKPVIGSNSGSVPYQIGDNDLIVPEGNVNYLSKKLHDVLNNPNEYAKIGMKLKLRAEKCFSITHLNELFYMTLLDVLEDKFDKDKADMALMK